MQSNVPGCCFAAYADKMCYDTFSDASSPDFPNIPIESCWSVLYSSFTGMQFILSMQRTITNMCTWPVRQQDRTYQDVQFEWVEMYHSEPAGRRKLLDSVQMSLDGPISWADFVSNLKPVIGAHGVCLSLARPLLSHWQCCAGHKSGSDAAA